MSAEIHARLYLVSGRVQGVGFRYFVEEEARALRLRGYVRNLYDGRVEVYAVGDDGRLAKLRRELEAGPPAARVERIEERPAPIRDEYRDFVIEPSGSA